MELWASLVQPLAFSGPSWVGWEQQREQLQVQTSWLGIGVKRDTLLED